MLDLITEVKGGMPHLISISEEFLGLGFDFRHHYLRHSIPSSAIAPSEFALFMR
jgi:hypothetical protein